MKIELINQEQYQTILDIQAQRPILTYQQKGYDSINPEHLNDEDRIAIKTIEGILEKHIMGFVEFNNFNIKNGEVVIRFQYNYKYDEPGYFKGVGYILAKQLLKGF